MPAAKASELLAFDGSVILDRHFYGETAAAYAIGRDAPYAERLLFTPATDTADPDEAVIALSMGRQMVEKVKDVFGAGTPPE